MSETIRYRILDNNEVNERSLYVAQLILEGIWTSLPKRKPPSLRFIRESRDGELIAPPTVYGMAKQTNRTIYIRADLSLDDTIYTVAHESCHVFEFDRGAPCDEQECEDWAENSWPESVRGKSYHQMLLEIYERNAWSALIDNEKGEFALVDEEKAESAIRCLRAGKAPATVIDPLEKELRYLRRLRDNLAAVRAERPSAVRERYYAFLHSNPYEGSLKSIYQKSMSIYPQILKSA